MLAEEEEERASYPALTKNDDNSITNASQRANNRAKTAAKPKENTKTKNGVGGK